MVVAMQHASALAKPPPLDTLRAKAPVAVFLDFDGTLVEIAPTHDSIAVPDGLAGALLSLAKTLNDRLALVSGRSLDDLTSHLGALAIAQAGSHGADCRLINGQRVGNMPKAMPKEVLVVLEELVSRSNGLSLEVKSHGAAVHYRAQPEIEDEIVHTATAIATQANLTVKQGNCVIELLSEHTDKGQAVREFMGHEPFYGSTPIFIGDDMTDEDGFEAVKEFAGFGVIVGGSRQTEACYRLDSPQHVYRWLGLEIK